MAAAARVVDAVVSRGQSADAALVAADAMAGEAPARAPDRSALRAIALGTLRWYLRLVPAVETLVARPAAVPAPVRALLTVAAHQVEYSRNAPQATVHAAVDAARLLETPRSAGLVNAVLRRFVRERAVLFERVDAGLAARTAHPAWLADRVCVAWPQLGESVLAANNAHPPMTLRIDLSRTSRSDYLARLRERSIDAHEIQWSQTAVTLARPVAIGDLPGFAEGLVSVQDAGAQLAAGLLGARAGMRVLDACAAPGGKTGHLLEVMGAEADLTALDIDADRLALIAENLGRLRRIARLCVGDASDPATFWDGRPFERILVDAPCSATGVIRRHPDIKLLRRASDLPAFAATQLALLRAATAMLAPGGRLLYSTCSVLPEENEQVVAALAAEEPLMRPAELPAATALAPGAIARSVGVQLLPGAAAGTDGFYYACLEKTTTGT
jgi:16S rRNA (cytosine967-C5)-methyltransferase